MWYFNPSIIPGTSYKLRWLYYLGEDRLVSLDALKLYQGEDMIRQNSEDIDLDWWLDKGELTELSEIPEEEAEVRVRKPLEDQRGSELYPEPDLDIPILPEGSKVITEREGIHDRIQSEIQHKDKEGKVTAEIFLEVSSAWNEVKDLIMEDEDGMMITEADTKQKRDKVPRGAEGNA